MAQKLNSNQIQPDCIQTVMGSTQTINPTGGIVNFNSTEFQLGDKLTRTGSSVVIGSGVSLVRASYALMSEAAGSAPYLFSRIRKNASDVSQQIDATGSTGGFKATSETRLVPVVQGDTIAVFADTGGGSVVAGRLSRMIVEVVAGTN